MAQKILGLVLSIIGLWFTSAGVIGEHRLRSFESRMREKIYGGDGFMRRVLLWPFRIVRRFFRWVYPTIGITSLALIIIFLVIGLVIFGLWYFFMKDIASLYDPGLEFIMTLYFACYLGVVLNFFTRGLPIIVIAMLLVPLFIASLLFLFSALIWLALIPYVIADKIALRTKLDSSIVLSGVVLGTIGIILLEF